MANIIITDGEQRAALAIVRSLGRAGHHCIVGSSAENSLAGRSRYAGRAVRFPDAASKPEECVEAVKAVVRSENADLVIPVTEASLLALLAVRDTLGATIPFPGLDSFRAVCDKKRVLATARNLGIRVPRQREIYSPAQAECLEAMIPLVLKPARSVFTAGDGTRGKVGVSWAKDRVELAAALRQYPEAAYPLLAQEIIRGAGIGVFVLIDEGECIARFSHLRVREKPPSGGVSVVRQSEPMDEALLQDSLRLLAEFGWSGVAMVEYKRDSVTGEPVLMEINGRFWGSLQLAIDAGVDFPRLLVESVLGHEIEAVAGYEFVRSRWFWGDVDNLLARWRSPAVSWRNRLNGVWDWLRACGPGYTEEVFRWSDPLPFASESAAWVGAVFRLRGVCEASGQTKQPDRTPA